MTEEPLPEYHKSHGRGKGEEVARQARALRTSTQVWHVSPGFSFPLAKGGHSVIPNISGERGKRKV